MTRRPIVGGMAAASAATVTKAADTTSPGRVRYLRHQVFFWLRNPESIADRNQLIAGLEKLRAIEVVRQLHVGVPAKTEERSVVDHSFAVSELMLFASKEDQLAYQLHPLHKAFVAECEPLWSKVVVYDSMDV